MKNKITITTDSETVSRIATISDNTISYTETPGIKVVMHVKDDELEIFKTGLIEMNILHKVDYSFEIDYQINLNGNEFFGKVEIKTKSLSITDKLIELKFEREGEMVYQKWEMR